MNQKIGTSSVDLLWACAPTLFKENENTDRYLYELDTWYKEDYPFWLKLQREMVYEVQ